MNVVSQHIKNSSSDMWLWTRIQPDGMRLFSRNGELFASVLLKVIPECDKLDHLVCQLYSNGNSVLHCLSRDPLNENQMDLIMIMLHQMSVQLHTKNNDNKTFLDLSAILTKLLQRIQTANDNWASRVLRACANNPEIIESWINLGNDALLEALFYRIRQSLPLNLVSYLGI